MAHKSIAICVFVCAATIGGVTLAAQNNVAAALNAYRPPTPVVDVNEAAKKPVVYWSKLTFEKPGEEVPGARLATYMESEDFFVPEGNILVIEYTNTVACFAPEEKMSIGLKTGYGEGRTPVNLKILLTEQGIFNEPGDGVYMHAGSSQQMKIYIRGGQAFRFTAWRSGGPTHAEVEFWSTGYLMPVAAQVQVKTQ